MSEQKENNFNQESCGDDLTLQRFLDEELNPDAAEVVLFHLENCVFCGERLQDLKVDKAFCREQLGREDELESEFTQTVLNRVRSRLDLQNDIDKPQDENLTGGIATILESLRSKTALYRSRVSWRTLAAPLALGIVFVALIAWVAISPSTTISADEVLTESQRRTAIWENQPEKVLHWGYEITYTNDRTLPDGKYTSLHWQYNTGGTALRLDRLYDANGVLVMASARRLDGSYLDFTPSHGDEIKVIPSRDVLLSYAAQLDQGSREAMENYVRSDDRTWQVGPERDLEIKRKSIDRSIGGKSLQIVETSDSDKVFRIEQTIILGKDKSAQKEIEHDIEANSFRMLRSREINHFRDGRITITDSKLKFYTESSVEDFNNHDLSAEIKQGKRIVYLTPEEILKYALRRQEEPKKDQ